MKKQSMLIIAALVVVVGGGYAAYSYAFRPLAAPSNKPPMQPGQMPPGGKNQEPPRPLAEAPADPISADLMKGATLYRISSDDSLVTFTLDEVLRGEPWTVVATTTHVTGDIALNMDHPSSSVVGKIAVNGRTFKTESSNRDRMIARFILEAEKPENEFVTFTPTGITGLPEKIVAGTAFDVVLAGDLKIRDISHPVTFTGSVTLKADDTLVGTAMTTVTRADYGLLIPNVPFVANVEETVELKIDLVAKKVAAQAAETEATGTDAMKAAE